MDTDGSVKLVINIQGPHGCFNHALLVVFVKDHEIGIDRKMISFHAQDAGTHGMECPQPQPLLRCILSDQFAHPAAH